MLFNVLKHFEISDSKYVGAIELQFCSTLGFDLRHNNYGIHCVKLVICKRLVFKLYYDTSRKKEKSVKKNVYLDSCLFYSEDFDTEFKCINSS